MRRETELIKERMREIGKEDIKPNNLSEEAVQAMIIDDWESVLKEMARCGFDVAPLFYDLQQFKNELRLK